MNDSPSAKKPANRNIVIGQNVSSAKVARAKELRQHMTPAERILWQCLRGNRLDGFHFRKQQIIEGFIADFYCHAAALVVEVDGKIHEKQTECDAKRDLILSTRGLRVLRIKNEEVEQNLEEVLRRIAIACTQTT